MKTINDYEDKIILIADLIKISCYKEEWKIINEKYETLYEGRVENLIWTKDGCAHELCEKQVDTIEVLKDGTLLIEIKGDHNG